MNTLEQQQQAICGKYSSAYEPLGADAMVAIALATLDKEPIYGVRIMHPSGQIEWFIYGGDEHSESVDFYQPVHTSHLNELLPGVEKYLALDRGFNFIFDRAGYEDVWYEEKA